MLTTCLHLSCVWTRPLTVDASNEQSENKNSFAIILSSLSSSVIITTRDHQRLYQYARTCMYACMLTYTTCMHSCIHVFVHVRIDACMRACMHACKYACMHGCLTITSSTASDHAKSMPKRSKICPTTKSSQMGSVRGLAGSINKNDVWGSSVPSFFRLRNMLVAHWFDNCRVSLDVAFLCLF